MAYIDFQGRELRYAFHQRSSLVSHKGDLPSANESLTAGTISPRSVGSLLVRVNSSTQVKAALIFVNRAARYRI